MSSYGLSPLGFVHLTNLLHCVHSFDDATEHSVLVVKPRLLWQEGKKMNLLLISQWCKLLWKKGDKTEVVTTANQIRQTAQSAGGQEIPRRTLFLYSIWLVGWKMRRVFSTNQKVKRATLGIGPSIYDRLGNFKVTRFSASQTLTNAYPLSSQRQQFLFFWNLNGCSRVELYPLRGRLPSLEIKSQKNFHWMGEINCYRFK